MKKGSVRLRPDDPVDRDGAGRDADAGVRDVEQALHDQNVVAAVGAPSPDGVGDQKVTGRASLRGATDAPIIYDTVAHGSSHRLSNHCARGRSPRIARGRRFETVSMQESMAHACYG